MPPSAAPPPLATGSAGRCGSSRATRSLSRSDELDTALQAVGGLLDRGGDPDDVLRGVVDVLHGLYPFAAIAFVEEGELAPGPSGGTPQEPLRRVDVIFRGAKVAELHVAGAADDAAFLERVAALISPHCLVGWDTGGVEWDSG